MKQSSFLIFATILLYFSTDLLAQTNTVFNLLKGDSVAVEVEARGSIQWEYSTDSIYWEELLGKTETSFYIVAEKNGYFRARVTEVDCDPVYSTPAYVRVMDLPPLALGLPVRDSLQVHLDAADIDGDGTVDIGREDNSQVFEWVDKSPNRKVATEVHRMGMWQYDYSVPVYKRLAIPRDKGYMPAVHFNSWSCLEMGDIRKETGGITMFALVRNYLRGQTELLQCLGPKEWAYGTPNQIYRSEPPFWSYNAFSGMNFYDDYQPKLVEISVFQPSGENLSIENLKVGANPSNHWGGFNGELSELIIYNRKLSPEEIGQVKDYLREKWLDPAAGQPYPEYNYNLYEKEEGLYKEPVRQGAVLHSDYLATLDIFLRGSDADLEVGYGEQPFRSIEEAPMKTGVTQQQAGELISIPLPGLQANKTYYAQYSLINESSGLSYTSEVERFSMPGSPVIHNPGAFSRNRSASLYYELQAGGASEISILVDSENDPRFQDHLILLGEQEPGRGYKNISGLIPGENYTYRIEANNSYGTNWSETSAFTGKEYHQFPRPAVGLIKWDAAADETTPHGSALNDKLSPKKWHHRVPFFGEILGGNRVHISALDPAVVEAEIDYLKQSGMDYFSFYTALDNPTHQPLSYSFSNFLSSPKKDEIFFCMNWSSVVFQRGSIDHQTIEDAVVNELIPFWTEVMSDPSYLRTPDGRPIGYWFINTGEIIRKNLGPPDSKGYDNSDVKRWIGLLGEALEANGTPRPYFVVNHPGEYPGLKTTMDHFEFDAISSYAPAPGVPGTGASPYINKTAAVAKIWEDARMAGTPIIPPVSDAFFMGPRMERPSSWSAHWLLTMESWYEESTPEEFAQHLLEAVTFVDNNRSVCEAYAIQIYAWSEFDEGGFICPTLRIDATTGLPVIDEATGKPSHNTDHIDAIRQMLDAYKFIR